MFATILLSGWLGACGSAETSAPSPAVADREVLDERPGEREERGPPPPGGEGPSGSRDQGQQHPPLPADIPVWDWDAGGFVPDFGWYGEHSWDDVRMRVAGHLAVAGRDKARVLAAAGELTAAQAVQADLAETLGAIEVSSSEVAARIQAILVAASTRDAALYGALAAGQAPADGGDGLAAARARYLGLAQRYDAGASPADLQRELDPLMAELRVLGQPRNDLDLAGFDDFNDRHELRVRLFDAAFDAADPLGLSEPWGYWESQELARQVAVLDQAVQALRDGPPDALAGTPAVGWPSLLAEREVSPGQTAAFTAEGLGWLPTGDSLIDVAAEPGPMAIGTLEKLGLEDADHAAWLAERADALNAALAADPSTVRPLITAMTAHFDAMGHGSRYYNIKQARNEAVRQLARAGHPELALDILRDNLPLHHQDWACPNREGILLSLEGRLLAEAGQRDPALAALDAAMDAGRAFLANADAAQVAGPHKGPGRTPPMLGGGGSPPPGGGPQGQPPPGARGGGPGPQPPTGGASGGPRGPPLHNGMPP